MPKALYETYLKCLRYYRVKETIPVSAKNLMDDISMLFFSLTRSPNKELLLSHLNEKLLALDFIVVNENIQSLAYSLEQKRAR